MTTDQPEENPDVLAAWPVPGAEDHAEPVQVYEAYTIEQAEIVRATLEAAGIPAFLNHATANPVVGALDASVGTAWAQAVFVAPSNVEAAQAILNATPLTEAELTAAEEADTTTLADAERRANEA